MKFLAFKRENTVTRITEREALCFVVGVIASTAGVTIALMIHGWR